MPTVGGAMSGYCATGRVKMAPRPPSVTAIASTQAKIGRAMKNRLSIGSLRWFVERNLDRLHRLARPHAVSALDDQLVAWLKAGVHQPFVPDGAFSRHFALLDFVVGVENERRRVPRIVARDALLRRKNAVRLDPLLN